MSTEWTHYTAVSKSASKFPANHPQPTPNYTNNSGGSEHGFNPVTRQNPCPICEKPDWCLVSADRSAAICPRVEIGSIKRSGDAGWLHIIGDHGGGYVHPSHFQPQPPKPTTDHGQMAKALVAGGASKLPELAGQLGVSLESLQRLGVGYSHSGWWSFPERDATGKTIGISRRFENGDKRQLPGSSRGLTYADDWNAGDGPLLLVEGGSDTAAVLTMGLPAIGRPSNRGGVAHLAELLDGFDRDIIVIGEHDEKPDGRCPGRDGAISTATSLAKSLHRTIAWSMPPDGAKDSRSWLNDNGCDGQRFIAGLDLQVIEPPKVYIPPTDVREVIGLEQWRLQLASDRVESLEQPGVYLDSSPTGSGKSFADKSAIRQATKSLVILPTHDNCREHERELRDEGLNAKAYPERTEQNCHWVDQCKRAESLGLAAQATVCQVCLTPRRGQTCKGYIPQIIEAGDADIAIATHKRATMRGLSNLSKDREFVAVHEDAVDLLRPTETITFRDDDDVDLAVIESLLREKLNNPKFLNRTNNNSTAQHLWLNHLLTCIENLRRQYRDTDTTCSMELEPGIPKPPGTDMLLYQLLRGPVRSKALRVVMSLAAGELDSLNMVVNNFQKDGGDRQTWKTIQAVWSNQQRQGTTTWFEDATATVERLNQLIDAPVIDRTPAGRLERLHKAVQVSQDVKISTRGKTVRGLIRGVLADHPDAQRVGIICHQGHKPELDKLSPEFRDRIVMVEHFGGGKDRSSNAWIELCDLLIVAGTPRIPPAAVREYLCQIGEIAAAAIEPEWGELPWQATTESGKTAVVACKAYQDERWQRAHDDLVRSAIVQAVGRGRGFQATGIPTVVLSNIECGLLLSDASLEPVSDQESHLLELTRANSNNSLLEKARVSSTTELATAAGISAGQARRLLSGLEKRGLIQRVGDRRGWKPVVSATKPPETKPAPEFDVATTITAWPTTWRLDFDERAGILEHDAGLTRTEAEWRAFVTIMQENRPRPPDSTAEDAACGTLRTTPGKFHVQKRSLLDSGGRTHFRGNPTAKSDQLGNFPNGVKNTSCIGGFADFPILTLVFSALGRELTRGSDGDRGPPTVKISGGGKLGVPVVMFCQTSTWRLRFP